MHTISVCKCMEHVFNIMKHTSTNFSVSITFFLSIQMLLVFGISFTKLAAEISISAYELLSHSWDIKY